MLDAAGKIIWVYDLEVFPNFFLASFINSEKRIFHHFELHDSANDIESLAEFVRSIKALAGFNSFSYDDIVLRHVLGGNADNASIYELSGKIINGGRNNKQIFDMQYSKNTPWGYSIDVFQLLNKRGALKEWECRQRARRVVESSADFTKPLPQSEFDNIRQYCRNDVYETYRLLKSKKHLYDLRVKLAEQYDLPKRVHVVGDAGVAQMVLVSMHERRTRQWASKLRDLAKDNPDNTARRIPMVDIISERVKFSTKPFKEMLNRLKETSAVGDTRGISWRIADKSFSKAIPLAGNKFKLGMGGLHSDDGPGVFRGSALKAIYDLDVTSYYPSIMITEELFPRHMGSAFIEDFTALRDARVKAKKTGDKHTNEALKIVINSTFGKLNDEYSPIRSIINAHRVTVNGQLMLLMLIERLHEAGAKILSANTDGVTIYWSRGGSNGDKLKKIMDQWTKDTGHELEMAEFEVYARRDVNNYLAKQIDGKVKKKGAFQPEPPQGKWDGKVIKMALEAYFIRGEKPEDFIPKCKDPADFLFYQRVQTGGHIYLGNRKIGKIARWYVAKKGEQVYRVSDDGRKARIPDGSNAVLKLDISSFDFEFPKDIDFAYYISETRKIISAVEADV